MKPVNQTTFGEKGNCYNACLASILEIPIESIPYYDGKGWLKKIEKWLRVNHNCSLLGFTDPYIIPAVYHIMIGPSPRGFNHAVVAFRGEMVHDPHPEGTGLLEIKVYEFLYPLTTLLRRSNE